MSSFRQHAIKNLSFFVTVFSPTNYPITLVHAHESKPAIIKYQFSDLLILSSNVPDKSRIQSTGKESTLK